MNTTSAPLKGLIPAAGKGVRAQPYTHEIHKGLLEVDGVPNLQHLITVMRDELGIRDITLVVGHLGDTIRQHFGDGSALGVTLHYVENTHLERGLAWSVLLGAEKIDSDFCMMLCDEFYLQANHGGLQHFDWHDALGVCTGLRVDDTALIRKNFSLDISDNNINRLVEKPAQVTNDLLGCGTFLFKLAIFDHIKQAFAEKQHAPVDFVTLLDRLVQQGQQLRFFELAGTYVNINDRDSLHLANYHRRRLGFEQRSIALLVYAEGDEENLAFTLDRYQELGRFSSINVVLPSDSSLVSVVQHKSATPLVCPPLMTGFGERLHYAMENIQADIVIWTDADYSFPAHDIHKLLAYLPEADMVIGTRTTRQLIEQGSDMRGIVRFAHSFLGKLVELLWWGREVRLTDTGCIFRAVWKSVYDGIHPSLHACGPEMSAEMMIALLDRRYKVIEIPVGYHARNKALQRAHQKPSVFFRFLALILRKRFGG